MLRDKKSHLSCSPLFIVPHGTGNGQTASYLKSSLTTECVAPPIHTNRNMSWFFTFSLRGILKVTKIYKNSIRIMDLQKNLCLACFLHRTRVEITSTVSATFNFMTSWDGEKNVQTLKNGTGNFRCSSPVHVRNGAGNT